MISEEGYVGGRYECGGGKGLQGEIERCEGGDGEVDAAEGYAAGGDVQDVEMVGEVGEQVMLD